VSAMKSSLSSEIYTGRPFGGFGFLCIRSLLKCTNIIDSGDNCRCLVSSLKIRGGTVIKVVNVYFPCSSNTAEYTADLGNCLGFIESLLRPNDSVNIIGDVNFTCTGSSIVFVPCKSVFDRLK